MENKKIFIVGSELGDFTYPKKSISWDDEINIQTNPIKIINQALKRNFLENNINFKKEKVYSVSHIKYDKNINDSHEFKLTRECICDGTLSFVYDLMCDIMQDLYSINIKPRDYNGLEDINYKIGNFELKTEYGHFSKEKPFLTCKFTIGLPVAYEYVLKPNKSNERLIELMIFNREDIN